MLKTISAALLVASIIAAPAFAAGVAKPDVAIKPVQTTTAAKATPSKSNVLNANARMGRHHVWHRFHRHHRHHMSALHGIKLHDAGKSKLSFGKTKVGGAKISLKRTTPAIHRG